ncbi:MAG: hypothetical protein EOM14_16380 [Clostridia bacterium]|nr:hypothetical protein [Clostridia bacterium]
MAFAALRDWVIENANNMVGKNSGYFVDDQYDKSSHYALVYDAEHDSILAEMFYYSENDLLQISYIALTPNDRNYHVSLQIGDISNGKYKEMFVGLGEIIGTSFTEDTDFWFSSFNGNPDDLLQCQEVIIEMMVRTLDITNSIYTQNITEYDIGDFGFAGFGD